ncbi:MAG: WG repeat-containing protein [Saprospiraceae bacterium]
MVKTGLSFILLFVIPFSLLSQQSVECKWVLPMQRGIVPVGKAYTDYAPAIQNGKGLFISATGDKKEMPYDSLTNEYGLLWKIYRNGYEGIYHLQKGELVPPVFDRVNPSLKKDNNWSFQIEKYRMSALVNDHNQMIAPYRKEPFTGLAFIGDTIVGIVKKFVSNPIVTDYDYVSYRGLSVSLADVRKQIISDFQRISVNQFVLTTYQSGKIKNDTFSSADKFIDDVAVAKRDSLWGYVSRNGTWLIKPKFQAAGPFDEDGNAVVKASGKYGIIKKDGSYVLAPKFTNLKFFLPGLFEIREGGNSGLIDINGKIIIPPGAYSRFMAAGTQCIAAKSGDSLLIFRKDGNLLPLGKVKSCSKIADNEFFLVQMVTSTHTRNESTAWGMLSPDGNWVIEPVIKGGLTERQHFLIIETNADPCCSIGGVNFIKNQRGRYLIFNKSGKPLMSTMVDGVKEGQEEKFVIYSLEKKYGLITSTGFRLEPQYDELKSLGMGWIAARQGDQWGILKQIN